MKEQIKEKLTSRKFWAMVFGVALALVNGDNESAYWILAAYLGFQSVADAAKKIVVHIVLTILYLFLKFIRVKYKKCDN